MKLSHRILKRFGFVHQSDMKKRSSFPAGQVDRLTLDWKTYEESADAELRGQLQVLRARSRGLRNGNDYAKKYLSTLLVNVLGENGIHFRNKARDPDRVAGGKVIPGNLDTFANKVIEDSWWDWGRRGNSSVAQNESWCDLQRQILETVAVDGECIIRKMPGFDNKWRFAVQVIESDHLDICLNRQRTRTQNEIRMGVELDGWRRPVAYWIFRANPNDNFLPAQIDSRYYRVNASEILHVFIKRRPMQTRGFPWMATTMTRLNMLGAYEEAELIAARAGASKHGFFKKTGDVKYPGEDDGTGNKFMDVEPGHWETLEEGLEPVSIDWNHPNTNYANFLKQMLRGIAGGLGNISYNTLGNDMESVNFASGKLGLEEERYGWKQIQNWFIESVCVPIFESWLEMALASGRIALPMTKMEKFNAPEFRGRRWQYINPQQEVTAKIAQLNAGLTSISRILAESGEDRDELFDEIAADKQAAEDRGITFSEVMQKEEEPTNEVDTDSGKP